MKSSRMIFNPSHLDSKEYSYPKTSGVQFAMVVPSTLRAIAFAYFASLCNATPADPTITSPPLLSKREAYDYYDFIGYYESDGVSSSCSLLSIPQIYQSLTKLNRVRGVHMCGD